jgi:hypothetical protein
MKKILSVCLLNLLSFTMCINLAKAQHVLHLITISLNYACFLSCIREECERANENDIDLMIHGALVCSQCGARKLCLEDFIIIIIFNDFSAKD